MIITSALSLLEVHQIWTRSYHPVFNEAPQEHVEKNAVTSCLKSTQCINWTSYSCTYFFHIPSYHRLRPDTYSLNWSMDDTDVLQKARLKQNNENVDVPDMVLYVANLERFLTWFSTVLVMHGKPKNIVISLQEDATSHQVIMARLSCCYKSDEIRGSLVMTIQKLLESQFSQFHD